MTDWSKKKKQLQNTVEKKRENNRPAAEVEKAQQNLEEHAATEPSQKWMLDVRELFRDVIKDPENFRTGALGGSSVNKRCSYKRSTIRLT